MERRLSPRHFILSVLLLFALVSIYAYFEARRFQAELLRQTEAKGAALADAMEANLRASILANGLLEDLIGQRLLDNARLIDELLQFPRTDKNTLREIAAANRLSKIELLDPKGQPLDGLPAPSGRRMQEMMARMGKPPSEDIRERHQAMMPFMWGRRWRLPETPTEPPPKIADKKFWQGSAFGVAIGARSFPGIIAVHANADYILDFRKQIDVQRQVDELGRQPDIEHIALVGRDSKILAHTDPARIHARYDGDPLKDSRRQKGAVVEAADGSRHYDVVRAIQVEGSPMGFVEIGLSLKPMETAWARSRRSTTVFGAGVLAVGIFGMAVIYFNQRGYLRSVRALEDEIRRRERLSELGNLAATVAHEIRNPLNSVSMGMQRLKAEFTPTADAAEYAHFLNLMQDEVRRLNGIVEQFLSLARPLELHTQAIAVEPLLREVAALIGAEAAAAKVEIQVEAAAGLPLLPADRNSLKQLLLNLILNGIQAMPNGGNLRMEARQEAESIRVEVIDRGRGIDADKLGKIFEPYFTTKTQGSGLGLAVARRIAEAHGGKIEVESAVGQGSVFRVSLPLRSEKVA